MGRSPSCFNLYWAWLLIFLGAHESHVADPMIEAPLRIGEFYTLAHFTLL
jgi:hypothetical protein